MRIRIAPAVLSILVALLLLAATGVQAKATKTPFTGFEFFVPVGQPDSDWMADGIWHIRGIPIIGFFAGPQFSWVNYVVFSFNLNLATGYGNGFGTCYFEVTWGTDSGTFERCRFTAKFGGPLVGVIGWVFTVNFVGHGSGDFEGMKIRGTGTGEIYPNVGWLSHVGIVLDPHG